VKTTERDRFVFIFLILSFDFEAALMLMDVLLFITSAKEIHLIEISKDKTPAFLFIHAFFSYNAKSFSLPSPRLFFRKRPVDRA
jgi:hypothetical protein